MGIFDRIRNAIFDRGKRQAQSSGQSAGTTTNRAPPSATGTSAPSGPAPAATPAPAGPASSAAPVDVEAVLERLAAEKGQQLNWRTSIVDLMKLLDLDSSLQHRQELARELGYTGSPADSATMNVWLHRQVMRKLAENGGRVPADLRD
jgi:3-oxoacyl-ACP reductase-like protein